MVATNEVVSYYSSVAPLPATKIRALIDARKLGHGGIGSYIERLISALSEESSIDISIIAAHDSVYKYSWAKNVEILFDAATPYSFDELWSMPARINWTKFDLFHAPHYTLPFRIPIPTVVTVHDLIHLTHPQSWYYPTIARPLIRSALYRASRVVAVSASTAQQIVELADGDLAISEKLSVISNIVDTRKFEMRERPIPQDHRRYLLAVFSAAKPHKGMEDLLRAYDTAVLAAPEVMREVDLVIAGLGATSEKAPFLRPMIDTPRLRDLVHIAGPVSDSELIELYRKAGGVVVPSRAEGFGLAVVEAQACGVPVFARPVPAMKELITERDMIADDFSIDSLSRGLIAFASHVQNENSRAVNRTHLAQFSPKSISTKMRVLYENVTKTTPSSTVRQ